MFCSKRIEMVHSETACQKSLWGNHHWMLMCLGVRIHIFYFFFNFRIFFICTALFTSPPPKHPPIPSFKSFFICSLFFWYALCFNHTVLRPISQKVLRFLTITQHYTFLLSHWVYVDRLCFLFSRLGYVLRFGFL